MNKRFLERVERSEVEPEYAAVTLRLLRGELWSVKIGLHESPDDHELANLRDRLQRAIEGMDEL
ncbi:MAG: hypothetical protein HF981_16195 [Desulfobacteraceae bacterium]|nr:hypothetical protein [Desulfobacteraceae bacterium]MBC2751930.1 hypothetical protein [Desulfobacteraceae bacterium]